MSTSDNHEHEYEYLKVERGGPCAWIWMNRPEVHNAFDETLIRELSQAFVACDAQADVRVIVLAAQGKSFSAGADLSWMKRQGAASQQENLEDARRLATLFRTIATCATPTVARVQGAALGGGLGLAAAVDICVASTAASFATTEVKFGIVPSAISPYVIRAIGERQALRYFQTAERFNADKACAMGLVHEVADAAELDAKVQVIVDGLLCGGPSAQAASTDLIRAVANRPVDDEVVEDTALRIAALRGSSEAREGLGAFLEKRSPSWMRS